MNKIALIGNGKLSKNYGKSIDKHDIVIRFNQAKIQGYEKQVGSKIDILSIVGETSLSYTSAIDKLDRYVLQQTKNIWITGIKHNKAYENLLKKRSGIIGEYQYLNYDCYIEICREIDSGFELLKFPSTGINTLCYCVLNYDIIKGNVNKLNVYGFDCFKTGHYMDNEKRSNVCHNLDMELQVIEYLKQYKNIKFFN